MMMRSILAIIFLAFVSTSPGLARAPLSGDCEVGCSTEVQVARQDADRDPQRYVIFIHAGNEYAALVEKMRGLLADKGYIVKNANDGAIGVPGIDYFNDEDKAGAETIAAILNPLLPIKLSPRRQLIANPSGFIGVWLPSQAKSATTGWYYLGKISDDKKSWLKSSAKDDLVFFPEIVEGQDIVGQIKLDKTVVFARGYKYLREENEKVGRRVDAKVAQTLSPGTRVTILETDASGFDPEDKKTVLWARVRIGAAQ